MESTPSPLAKPGLGRPLRIPRADLGPGRHPRRPASHELAIEALEETGGTRMCLTGALTARTAVPFKHAVARLADQTGMLVIDLQAVPRLDPTGLAALAAATEIGLRQGCRVVITNVPQGARRWIAQASLHKAIELGD